LEQNKNFGKTQKYLEEQKIIFGTTQKSQHPYFYRRVCIVQNFFLHLFNLAGV
jgi:hypothetical protein